MAAPCAVVPGDGVVWENPPNGCALASGAMVPKPARSGGGGLAGLVQRQLLGFVNGAHRTVASATGGSPLNDQTEIGCVATSYQWGEFTQVILLFSSLSSPVPSYPPSHFLYYVYPWMLNIGSTPLWTNSR